MSNPVIKAIRRTMELESRKYTDLLVELPEDQWPKLPWIKKPDKVFRSRRYIVQVFREDKGLVRISVNRAEVEPCPDPPGWRFRDGISWDQLQEIKNAVGFENHDAVEIYPSKFDEVNVANMRHVWVCPGPVWFAWRNPERQKKIVLARNMHEAGRILKEGQ